MTVCENGGKHHGNQADGPAAAGHGPIMISMLVQALGEGLHSLLMSAFRQLVLILPIAWLLSLSGNVNLVWYSFLIAEAVSLCFALTLFRRSYNTKIKHLGGV